MICKIQQHPRIISLISFNSYNLLLPDTTKSFFIQIDWRDSSFQKMILNLLNKKPWLNFDKDWLASHWNDTAFQYFTWVVIKDIKHTYASKVRFRLYSLNCSSAINIVNVIPIKTTLPQVFNRTNCIKMGFSQFLGHPFTKKKQHICPPLQLILIAVWLSNNCILATTFC